MTRYDDLRTTLEQTGRGINKRLGHRCHRQREGWRPGHQQEAGCRQQARLGPAQGHLRRQQDGAQVSGIKPEGSIGNWSLTFPFTGPTRPLPTRLPGATTAPTSALPPFPVPAPSAGPRGPPSPRRRASSGATLPRRLLPPRSKMVKVLEKSDGESLY